MRASSVAARGVEEEASSSREKHVAEVASVHLVDDRPHVTIVHDGGECSAEELFERLPDTPFREAIVDRSKGIAAHLRTFACTAHGAPWNSATIDLTGVWSSDGREVEEIRVTTSEPCCEAFERSWR